jgi:pilus assembly protein CpaE
MPERPSPTRSRRVTPNRVTPVPSPARPRADRGSVIAVYGARADVGVTTVAAALALAFRALDVGEVGFAELNARAASVGGRPATPAASDTPPEPPTQQESENRVPIQGTHAALERRSDGVWTLSMTRTRIPAIGDAKAVTAALDVMRGRFAVSVAELGHQVTERALAAFDAADRILLVTEGAVPSLRSSQRVLRLCQRLNYPDEKMCVVVNRFDAPGAMSPMDIAAALRREVYWKIPAGSTVDVVGLAAKLADR